MCKSKVYIDRVIAFLYAAARWRGFDLLNGRLYSQYLDLFITEARPGCLCDAFGGVLSLGAVWRLHVWRLRRRPGFACKLRIVLPKKPSAKSLAQFFPQNERER